MPALMATTREWSLARLSTVAPLPPSQDTAAAAATAAAGADNAIVEGDDMSAVTLNASTLEVFRGRLSVLKPIPIPASITRKKAAVMVPLCLVNGVPSVLFTIRSKTLRNHSGEVRYGPQDVRAS